MKNLEDKLAELEEKVIDLEKKSRRYFAKKTWFERNVGLISFLGFIITFIGYFVNSLLSYYALQNSIASSNTANQIYNLQEIENKPTFAMDSLTIDTSDRTYTSLTFYCTNVGRRDALFENIRFYYMNYRTGKSGMLNLVKQGALLPANRAKHFHLYLKRSDVLLNDDALFYFKLFCRDNFIKDVLHSEFFLQYSVKNKSHLSVPYDKFIDKMKHTAIIYEKKFPIK